MLGLVRGPGEPGPDVWDGSPATWSCPIHDELDVPHRARRGKSARSQTMTLRIVMRRGSVLRLPYPSLRVPSPALAPHAAPVTGQGAVAAPDEVRKGRPRRTIGDTLSPCRASRD